MLSGLFGGQQEERTVGAEEIEEEKGDPSYRPKSSDEESESEGGSVVPNESEAEEPNEGRKRQKEENEKEPEESARRESREKGSEDEKTIRGVMDGNPQASNGQGTFQVPETHCGNQRGVVSGLSNCCQFLYMC